jgi:ADP-heptose:LPS heptosyltransferase
MTAPPVALLRPRRVAVLRALMLGDLLCAVPMLRALRDGLPEAEITLVGLGWARDFAGRYPAYLDDFLELPGFPGLPERPPDVTAVPAVLAAAQARGFDLVVQAHGSGEATNALAVLLGGRSTAGFYRPGTFCPDPELFLPYPDHGPEPQRLLRLAEFLGLPATGDELEFPLHERDRADLAAVREAGTVAPDAYVCVHPGARLQSRRWPPELFAAVADGLAQQGYRVVLTGSESERPLTARVAAAMEEPAVDLAGLTTLGALAALLAGARLLVCNDTGVSHLAAALRVPSVVVFRASDPARWAPRDAGRHRVVAANRARADVVLAEAASVLETEVAVGV